MIDTYFRRQNKNGDINLPTNSFLAYGNILFLMSNFQNMSVFLCFVLLFSFCHLLLHSMCDFFVFNFLFNKNYVFIFPLDVANILIKVHKNITSTV